MPHAIDLAATGLDRVLGTLTPAEFLEQTWSRYRSLDTPQPMIDYAGRWLRERLLEDPEQGQTYLFRQHLPVMRQGEIDI